MPVVGVQTQAAQQLLQPNQQEGVSIQNIGPGNVYLGSDGSLSATNFGWYLTPGSSIVWQPGQALWLIADAANTKVNYLESTAGGSATNVTATLNGPVTVGNTVAVAGNVNSTPVGTTSVAGTVNSNGQASSTLLATLQLTITGGQAAGTFNTVTSPTLNITNYTALEVRLDNFTGTGTGMLNGGYDPLSFFSADIYQDNNPNITQYLGLIHNHAEWFMLTAGITEYSYVFPAYQANAVVTFSQGNVNAVPNFSFGLTQTVRMRIYGLVDPAPSVRYVADYFTNAQIPSSNFGFGDQLAAAGNWSNRQSQAAAGSLNASFPVTSRNKPTSMNVSKDNVDTGVVLGQLQVASMGTLYTISNVNIPANASPQDRQTVLFTAPSLPLVANIKLRTAATACTLSLTQ